MMMTNEGKQCGITIAKGVTKMHLEIEKIMYGFQQIYFNFLTLWISMNLLQWINSIVMISAAK